MSNEFSHNLNYISDEEIEAAADWVDRLADGNATPDTLQDFQQWLDDGKHRHELYKSLLKVWQNPALEQTLKHSPSPLLQKKIKPSRLRLSTWLCSWPSLAMTTMLILGIIVLPELNLRNTTLQYQTRIAETRTIPLDDGSTVNLNARSLLQVSFNKQRRLLELNNGEAFFDVAKDAKRPFVVRSAGVAVIAVGTQFNIDKSADRLDITVHEGVIRIHQDRLATTASASASTNDQLFYAGEHISIYNGQLISKRIDILQHTDWRQYWLELNNHSLTYLVEHLNRYSPQTIRIDSSTLAQQRVAGRFNLKNVSASIDMLAALYDLGVTKTSDSIVLFEKPAKP